MSRDVLDPKLRVAVLDALKESLFGPPTRRLKKRMAELIDANSHLCKNSDKCFSFRGRHYESVNHYGVYPRPMNLLQPSLRPAMKLFWGEQNELAGEQDLVIGYVQKLMLASDRLEDYLALMPDTLHGVLKKFTRNFSSAGGRLSQEEREKFLEENDKYIRLMKSRMVENLLDPG